MPAHMRQTRLWISLKHDPQTCIRLTSLGISFSKSIAPTVPTGWRCAAPKVAAYQPCTYFRFLCRLDLNLYHREVHMSDLIKAHEGNNESNSQHPGKIHWGKFNMMGKFISSTTQCQTRCRLSTEYKDFKGNSKVEKTITSIKPMEMEVRMQCLINTDLPSYNLLRCNVLASQLLQKMPLMTCLGTRP